jgi:ribosome-binding protein aMBF1 (putative translation factor)
LLENRSDQLFAASKEGGVIRRVCVASATFSSRLERKALKALEPARDNARRSTDIGRNIDKLRKECGWSFDQLADETGIDKKLILSHVNKGARPVPRILKEYAQTFSKGLQRKITVSDLES